MALYTCINCGNKVSSEGVNCPKCGYPIAKTLTETEKTKAEQQLHKRQLDYIKKAILDNQSWIENLLKAHEEAVALSKMSTAITAWEEHLRKKAENYPDAEKVLGAIQKRFPVECEEIKKEVDAEFLSKTVIFTNDKSGESGKCPECGTTYSANLIECPSCGWTENHKLAEEFRRVEQERTRMLCIRLESVVICEGVLSVDSSAFSGCKKLKNITLPSSVIRIGAHAFSGCESLESITIPDRVEEFGEGAFSGCEKLKNFVIPDSVTILRGSAFAGCKSLESIVVPNGVEIIEGYAFSKCEKLKSFVIPDSVTVLGGSAFADCKSLESIVVPKGVKCIGLWAFSGCKKLKHIDIPSSVTDISYSVFEGCEKLVIRVRADSYAHTYMKEKRNDFEETGGSRTSKSFRVRKKEPKPTFKFETTYENACRDEVKSSYDYIGGLRTHEEEVQFAMERMERGEYD